MSTIKSIIKQTIARVTGDTATVIGEKNYRLAKAAISSELHNLNGLTVELEQSLEDAKENSEKAFCNNGVVIESRPGYVAALLTAENGVTLAENAIEKHKKKIAVLEAKLAQLEEEVEA